MVNLCQLENYAAARRVPTVLVAEKEFDDHHLHGHCHHGCDDRSRIYNVSPLNPFSILWTLTSDQQLLRLTQPRRRFWRATPWGQILKTNVSLVFSYCVNVRFFQSSILKNVYQPSSKCTKWTCGTSYLCLTKEFTFSNRSSCCTPGEPTHTCSCRPGRHPPWRRRWRSRGRPCGRRTGTASGPNRNQSL